MARTRITTPMHRAPAVALLAALVLGLTGCSSLLPTTTETVTVTVTATPDAGATVEAEDIGASEPSPAPGDEAAAAPSEVDVCAMFSKAEAEKLAGMKLGAGVAAPGTCSYTSAPSGATAQVSVFIGDGAKQTLDTDRNLEHVFETLKGVGEEAYLENSTIFVRVGQTWGEISLLRFNEDAANRTPLIAAATRLASRM